MELRAAQLNNESAMEMREREILVSKRKRSSSSTWASKSPYADRGQSTPSGRRCPKINQSPPNTVGILKRSLLLEISFAKNQHTSRDKFERSEMSARLFLTEDQTLSQQTEAAPDNRGFPQKKLLLLLHDQRQSSEFLINQLETSRHANERYGARRECQTEKIR